MSLSEWILQNLLPLIGILSSIGAFIYTYATRDAQDKYAEKMQTQINKTQGEQINEVLIATRKNTTDIAKIESMLELRDLKHTISDKNLDDMKAEFKEVRRTMQSLEKAVMQLTQEMKVKTRGEHHIELE